MKIVIISDLHGNYDALTALPEVGDELWVLGDIVNYGPLPAETVSWVRNHSQVVIRGNHDDSVGHDRDPRCTPRYHEMAESTRKYSLAQLSQGDKEYLRDLPLRRTVERDGVSFYLCHAIPSNPLYGYCPEESERWKDEVAEVKANFLLVGHTHTPFIKKIRTTTIVNPGSLGQPKTGKADACYAVWEDGRLELRQYPYPVATAIQRIEKLPVSPEVKQDLSTVLRTGSI